MFSVLLLSAVMAMPLSSSDVHALVTTTAHVTIGCDVPSDLHAALFGGGRIKGKNGNTYQIQSDDSNMYFAISEVNYPIGVLIYHSDPLDGWVEILGLQ